MSPRPRIEGVERFFAGLFDPKEVARRDAEAAGISPVFDDRGLVQRANNGLAAARSMNVNPYDSSAYLRSRASLASALGAMGGNTPSVSSLSGMAAQRQATLAQGAALGASRGGQERLASLQAGGQARAQTAEQAGAQAVQEQAADQSGYAQGLAGLSNMDLVNDEAAKKAELQAKQQQQEDIAYYTSMLEKLEAAKGDAQLDYDELVTKIEKEAREGSFATLGSIIAAVGAVAPTATTLGAAAPVAGAAAAGAA